MNLVKIVMKEKEKAVDKNLFRGSYIVHGLNCNDNDGLCSHKFLK